MSNVNKELPSMTDQKSILVVGIGNPYRADDGIGLKIACRLGKMLSGQVVVRTHIGDGFSLIDMWREYDIVYLIDAVKGRNPGKIYRFNAVNEPLPQNFFTNYSTHSLDIFETIALAGNLDLLPDKLIIYGVEGKDFRMGSGFSKEVLEAIFRVADCIKNEIEK
jgi:hydrogenase maturation protease